MWTENRGEDYVLFPTNCPCLLKLRVLSSIHILLPQSPKIKNNSTYILTHITTIPQREIKEQFL